MLRTDLLITAMLMCLPAPLQADEVQPTEVATSFSSPADFTPEHIGFLDMADVFKRYKKFKTALQDMRDDVASAGLKGKRMVDEARRLVEAAKRAPEGSAERREIEEELVKKHRQAEDFKREQQQRLVRKEADVYKTVYLEVMAVVREVANEQKLTIVFRFDRTSIADVDGKENIVKVLNRQVLFHRVENDMTDEIVERLNSKSAATKSKSAE